MSALPADVEAFLETTARDICFWISAVMRHNLLAHLSAAVISSNPLHRRQACDPQPAREASYRLARIALVTAHAKGACVSSIDTLAAQAGTV